MNSLPLDKDKIIADLGTRNAGLETLITNTIGSLQSLGTPSAMTAADVRRQINLIANDMMATFARVQFDAAARAGGDRQVESAQVLPFGAPAEIDQVPA